VRRDRSSFRRALEVSLLLHLLLVFLIAPQVEQLWPASNASAVELVPEVSPDSQPPLEFEFVDLAEEREEEPVSDRVPLSDLDRRAHGGEGEAASRPGVQGTTPQLVEADGGQFFGAGSPPTRPGEQVPSPCRLPEGGSGLLVDRRVRGQAWHHLIAAVEPALLGTLPGG